MTSSIDSTLLSRPTSTGEMEVQRRLLSRLVGFILLEIIFIALAVTCLFYQLPCSISSSPTFTKAFFTNFFIAWHTLAAMCAQEIISHTFGGEWYFLYEKHGKLIPGYTDRVSTISSGFKDYLQHFTSRSTTLAYRFSYIIFWVIVVLSRVAPGSINVNDIQYFAKTTVSITNFTATGGDIQDILGDIIDRTANIVEVEIRENTPTKFTIEQNVIVGWPDLDAGKPIGDIKYLSDVLMYNMSCWWEAPTFNMTRWNTTTYAGGFAWYPWSPPDPDAQFDGGLMAMYRFSPDQGFLPDHFPLPLPAVPPVGLSGYLLYGHNSSFTPTKKRALNLDNLPTTFNNESGFHFIDFNGANSNFTAPIASFLLCDPGASILDGLVLLNQANSSLAMQSISPPIGQPKVGNISPDAANVALGLSLTKTLDVDEDDRIRVGIIASQVFLNDTSLDFSGSRSKQFDIGILPLQEIQHNLNRIMQSGSKAVSSYTPNVDSDAESQQGDFQVVSGGIQEKKQVLVSSPGFVVATIFCVFTIAIVMTANIFYLRIWRTPVFGFDLLVRLCREDECLNEGMTHPSPKDNPSASVPHRHPYPETKTLLLRLLGFVALEIAFLSLILICSKSPIIIDVPLPLAEVKGSFTVFFILWQNLAIFLVSDAVTYAFGCEWSLQRHRTNASMTNEMDRVSRLTSGNVDRIRYFFARRASTTFRIAFATFLALVALSSSAPGALSVGPVITPVNTTLQIADLSLVTSSLRGDNDNNFNFLVNRAEDLTLLEHHEDFNFRYDVEPNWIIAWPDEKSMGQEIIGMVEYPTDVIRFNYSCEWRKPDMGSDDDTNATTWLVDGQIWELWSEPRPDIPYRGGILPLYRYLDLEPDSLLAAVVFGTNDTLPTDSDEGKRSILNLNDLPTLYHPSGITLIDFNGDPSQWISPLSTILYCNPQTDVSGGRARLSPSKTLSVVASGMPLVENIPNDAMTTIFTSGLLDVLDTNTDTGNKCLSTSSIEMFLQDTSLNLSIYPAGIPLHNLSALNENFNSFFLSASKAFLDGLRANSNNFSDISMHTMFVIGLGEVEMQALTGDETLGIVSLCLSVGTVILYGMLVRWLSVNRGEPFVLANILPAISSEKEESSSPLC